MSGLLNLGAAFVLIAYGLVVVAIMYHNDSWAVRMGLQPEAKMFFPLFLAALVSAAWLCAGVFS